MSSVVGLIYFLFYKLYHQTLQIAVHYGGVFYEFVPWNGSVTWEISPWGHWYITAENETHKVNFDAKVAIGQSIQMPKWSTVGV